MTTCLDLDLRQAHSDCLLLTFLNVGQGHSVLVRVPGGAGDRFGVIDSHWWDKSTDAPARKCLLSSDIRNLEFVVLTHPHKDHYLGIGSILEDYSREGRSFERYFEPRCGSLRVLEQRLERARNKIAVVSQNPNLTIEDLMALALQPKRRNTLSGQLARIVEYTHRTGSEKRVLTSSGDIVELTDVRGELQCQHLSPSSDDILQFVEASSVLVDENPDINAISLGLLLIWQEARILVCGDLPDSGWNRVLDSENDTDRLRSNVIDVGHHGGTGNGDRLWRSITLHPPAGVSTAVISAGYRNSYDHPREDTLQRILRNGCCLYCISRATPCEELDVLGAARSPVEQALDYRSREKTAPVEDAKVNGHQRRAICSGQITLAVTPSGRVDIVNREQAAACAYQQDSRGT